jgi:hypothetical protein
MIQGIDVVFIHSPYKELKDWYAKMFDLETVYSDETWNEFRMKSVSRFAVEFNEFPRSVIENQAVMISFRVADIHTAVRMLAERGVQFFPSTEKAIFQAGPSLVATFQDPAGNWMQLSQRI